MTERWSVSDRWLVVLLLLMGAYILGSGLNWSRWTLLLSVPLNVFTVAAFVTVWADEDRPLGL